VRPEPGARIHFTDPFAVPESARSPVRRLRGRLAATVTLWTAYGPGVGTGQTRPAGLTVSSTLVAEGEPGRLLGLIDEESELWAAMSATRRFVVMPLGPAHRRLADRFAGLFPAPGGLFAAEGWTETAYGPVLDGAGTWVGCQLDSARECGWALLVEAAIETVELAADPRPLLHYRGRYRDLAD
jgi:3-hydroxy-9,10-secoandrosta-1,3,5(10)-triene-9,17-dione monooxygenase reductase component